MLGFTQLYIPIFGIYLVFNVSHVHIFIVSFLEDLMHQSLFYIPTPSYCFWSSRAALSIFGLYIILYVLAVMSSTSFYLGPYINVLGYSLCMYIAFVWLYKLQCIQFLFLNQ